MIERVVCTGGAGKLGQHVVRRLQDQYQTTIVDLKSPVDSDLANVPFRSADITDLAAMRDVFEGADAVIHLAAIPNPRTAPADVTFGTNVQGAWAVCQAAEEAEVKRLVVASSDSVFGLSYNPPDWPPQFLPVDETHPTRPSEFYSLSKRVTETIAESYAARGKYWRCSSSVQSTSCFRRNIPSWRRAVQMSTTTTSGPTSRRKTLRRHSPSL